MVLVRLLMLSKNNQNNKTVLATLGFLLLSLSVVSSIAISTPYYARAQGITVESGGNATNATMTGAGNATNATMTGAGNATNATMTGTNGSAPVNSSPSAESLTGGTTTGGGATAGGGEASGGVTNTPGGAAGPQVSP